MEVKANKEYSLQKDHSSDSRSDISLYTIQRKDTLEKVRVASNVSTRGWEPVTFPNVSSRLEQYPQRRPQTTYIRISRGHVKNTDARPLPLQIGIWRLKNCRKEHFRMVGTVSPLGLSELYLEQHRPVSSEEWAYLLLRRGH